MRPVVCCLALSLLITVGGDRPSGRLPVSHARGDVAAALGALEFVPNLGQWDDRVRFAALGDTLGWLHDDGYTLQLQRWTAPDRDEAHGDREEIGCVVRARFVAADAPEHAPSRPTATVRHFLRGDRSSWRTHVPSYERVAMNGVWPGVDLVFRPLPDGQRGPFEYDVHLAAGADLERVVTRLEGVEGLRIDDAGRLCARVAVGAGHHELVQSAPIAWQETANGPRPIVVRFRLLDDTTFGFAAAELDPALATVVDPGVVWGTFLGGGLADRVNALRWREGIGVWVGGWAGSTDFPTTSGAYRTTGGADAFVARLNDAGTALQFATYLGGSEGEEVRGIDLGPGDTPTVVGFTRSTNFPTTPSAFQASFQGASLFIDIGDAFVVRLTAAGDALIAATYLGGNYDDVAEAVFVDATGAATVVGWSTSSNFPTTPGAVQPGLVGIPGIQSDGFVTRVAANAQSLAFSTLNGGQLSDRFLSVDRDPTSGDWVAAGTSGSFDYPTTPNAVGPSQSGALDGIVTRFNPAGTARVFSTYVGGPDTDQVSSVQVAPNGTVWLGGFTLSPTFATTPGAPQAAFGGQSDGFLRQLTGNGQALLFSTFVGGSGLDKVRAIDVTSSALIAVGEAGAGLPVTPNAAQATFAGGNLDAFVAYYTNNGATLTWSSYFGGVDQDSFASVALANSGLAVVAGRTFSADFPIAPATLQPTVHGIEDGLVMKFDLVSSFGDSLEIGSEAADEVQRVAPGEHELMRATLTNTSPRDIVVDAVRLFVGGAGDATQSLSAVRVTCEPDGEPGSAVAVAGPLAVPFDDREFVAPLNGCLVPAESRVRLRVLGTLAADPSGATAEIELAIVDTAAWTVHAVGATGGPEVSVRAPGRAEAPTLVLGALPGDADGDGEHTVVDVRRQVVGAGLPSGAADVDGDGVVGAVDLSATRDALLGRASLVATPAALVRGDWFALAGVFPDARSAQATLGGRALTLGSATPRQLTFFVAGDQPQGTQEFVVAVAGRVVLATLVAVQ